MRLEARVLVVVVVCFSSLGTGCGLQGLWMEIPPYQAPDEEVDVGPDAQLDVGESDAHDAYDIDVQVDTPLIAPQNVSASSTPSAVVLTWDRVEGASGYEVRVNSGGWLAVGDVSTYEDKQAPPGVLIGELTASVSEGTFREHVALTRQGTVAVAPGDVQEYEVRATREDRVGPPSALTNGFRVAGAVTYSWERYEENVDGFEELGTSIEDAFLDRDAPLNGSRERYRVCANAESGSRICSDEVEGWKLAVSQVSAGFFHSCALLTNGAVKCWGGNSKGELGYEDRMPRGGTPGTMPPPDVEVGFDVKSIHAFRERTCAVSTDGRVACWGWNFDGALGLESGREDIGGRSGDMPPGVLNMGGDVETLVGGIGTQCAQMSDGKVRCWGGNSFGMLGVNAPTTETVGGSANDMPPSDALVGGAVERIAAGTGHVCATMSNGELTCWGGFSATTNYMLGILPSPTEPLGVGAGDLPHPPIAFVDGAIGWALGESHTCALLNSGDVECWGENSYGQLGGDTGSYPVSTTLDTYKVRLDTALLESYCADVVECDRLQARPVSIASDGYTTCLLYDVGGVVCWGDGAFDYAPSDAPTLLGAPRPIESLSSEGSSSHMCFVDDTGRVKCRGTSFTTPDTLGYEGAEVDIDSPAQYVELW